MDFFNFPETVTIKRITGNRESSPGVEYQDVPAIVLRSDPALNMPGTDDVAWRVEVLLPPSSDVTIGDRLICYGTEYCIKSFRSCRDLAGKLRAWRLNGVR